MFGTGSGGFAQAKPGLNRAYVGDGTFLGTMLNFGNLNGFCCCIETSASTFFLISANFECETGTVLTVVERFFLDRETNLARQFCSFNLGGDPGNALIAAKRLLLTDVPFSTNFERDAGNALIVFKRLFTDEAVFSANFARDTGNALISVK